MFHLKWLLYIADKSKGKELRKITFNPSAKPISEQGLSLIECLMAIMVIALTGAMMLPPLFVATANRVQNRKAEQALQLAQGEVDRVRALVEQKTQDDRNLPKVATNVTSLSEVPAPGSISSITRSVSTACDSPILLFQRNPRLAATRPLPSVNELLNIDLDGEAGCEPEFLMQIFRTEATNDQFDLGVRVYSSVANPESQALKTEEASLKHTTGTGNQKVLPLAVLYTEIKAVNAIQSMCKFQYHSTCN